MTSSGANKEIRHKVKETSLARCSNLLWGHYRGLALKHQRKFSFETHHIDKDPERIKMLSPQKHPIKIISEIKEKCLE